MKNFKDVFCEDGKTIYQKNMETEHEIPIGTLVEIQADNEDNGIRLYVCEYRRDCDGEPLYLLSSKGNVLPEKPDIRDFENSGTYWRRREMWGVKRGAFFGPYSKDSLKVIT